MKDFYNNLARIATSFSERFFQDGGWIFRLSQRWFDDLNIFRWNFFYSRKWGKPTIDVTFRVSWDPSNCSLFRLLVYLNLLNSFSYANVTIRLWRGQMRFHSCRTSSTQKTCLLVTHKSEIWSSLTSRSSRSLVDRFITPTPFYQAQVNSIWLLFLSAPTIYLTGNHQRTLNQKRLPTSWLD